MSETPNKTEKIEFKAVKTDKEPFEETPTIAKPLPISFNRVPFAFYLIVVWCEIN